VIILIVFISVLFGIGRFYIPGHALTLPGTYETFAHIWSGFLLGIAVPEFRWLFTFIRALLFRDVAVPPMPPTKGAAGFSVLTISLIEAYMFVHQGWFQATFH
jgi:hypothetical protein